MSNHVWNMTLVQRGLVLMVVYHLVIKRGNGKSSMNGGFNRKSTYKWSISIAMFDYRRVNGLIVHGHDQRAQQLGVQDFNLLFTDIHRLDLRLSTSMYYSDIYLYIYIYIYIVN